MNHSMGQNDMGYTVKDHLFISISVVYAVTLICFLIGFYTLIYRWIFGSKVDYIFLSIFMWSIAIGIFIIENWWNAFIDKDIIAKNFKSFLIVIIYPILIYGLVVLLYFDILTLDFDNPESSFVYNDDIISHLMLGLSATLLYHLLIMPQAHSRLDNEKTILFKNKDFQLLIISQIRQLFSKESFKRGILNIKNYSSKNPDFFNLRKIAILGFASAGTLQLITHYNDIVQSRSLDIFIASAFIIGLVVFIISMNVYSLNITPQRFLDNMLNAAEYYCREGYCLAFIIIKLKFTSYNRNASFMYDKSGKYLFTENDLVGFTNENHILICISDNKTKENAPTNFENKYMETMESMKEKLEDQDKIYPIIDEKQGTIEKHIIDFHKQYGRMVQNGDDQPEEYFREVSIVDIDKCRKDITEYFYKGIKITNY